jgi:hypothetical protein
MLSPERVVKGGSTLLNQGQLKEEYERSGVKEGRRSRSTRGHSRQESKTPEPESLQDIVRQTVSGIHIINLN